MGNSKSKNSPYAGHEKLDENDERYFRKVQDRNKIKTRDMTIPPPSASKKRSRRGPRLGGGGKSKSPMRGRGASAGGSGASQAGEGGKGQSTREKNQNNSSRISMMARSQAATDNDSQGGHSTNQAASTPTAGPLDAHTTVSIPKIGGSRSKDGGSVGKSRRESSRAGRGGGSKRAESSRSAGSEGSGGTNNVSMIRPPRGSRDKSDRSLISVDPSGSGGRAGGGGGGGALSKKSPSQRRLEKARGGTGGSSRDHRSSKSKRRAQKEKRQLEDNIYKEMIKEASGESISDSDHGGVGGGGGRRGGRSGRGGRGKDESKIFEAMLPSGMVWADIPRGGKVTCLALSPPAHAPDPSVGGGGGGPLLLAIGTDDGFVAIMEILDDGGGGGGNGSGSSVGSVGGPVPFSGNDLLASKKKKYGSVRELPREGKIRSLHFSPDGRRLVVGGDDCTASVVDVGLQIPLPGELPAVGSSESSRGTLGQLSIVHELEREDRVYAVRYSPDGSMLAIGGFDGLVAIAAVPERNNVEGEMQQGLDLIAEIPRLGLVLSVDWSPDGTLLAIGGSDKRAAIVDASGGASGVAKDGEMIAEGSSSSLGSSGGGGGGTGSMEVIGEIQRPASVQCVKWSPDGSLLAVGGHDGTVAVIDIESRSVVKEITRGADAGPGDEDSMKSAGGGGGACRISAVCWSPDGTFLAIGGSDDACAILETKTFVLVHEIRRSGHVTCVDWGFYQPSPGEGVGPNAGGRYLAVGGDDRAVAILKTGTEDTDPGYESTDDEASATSSQASSCATNSSFSSYASGSRAGSEWVLNDTFEDIDDMSLSKTGASGGDGGGGNKVVIRTVAFSRTGSRVDVAEFMAVATNDGNVNIISTYDWVVVTEMNFSKPIRTLHFSSTSRYLALGGDDSVAYIVDVQTWTVESETSTTAPIFSLRFSTDDGRLAIGAADGMLSLLDSTDKWSVSGEMDSSESTIRAMDWSSNGRYLAIGRNDATVTVHDSSSVYGNFFVPQAELSRGSNAPVHALGFGVGGKFLAVGGGDWAVGIYSEKGGWVLCHQLKMDGWVLSVGWSPDGRYLGVGGTDQSKGGIVIDTISWDAVDELGGRDAAKPGIGIGEESTSLDWSDDGRWFVVAGNGGKSRVVNTSTWEVSHCLDHMGNPCETTEHEDNRGPPTEEEGGDVQSEQQQGNDHENNANSILADLAASASTAGADMDWSERPIVREFTEVCERFLELYEPNEPPYVLRMYVPCILMLQVHVRWVGTVEPKNREEIARLDDGEPLSALSNILSVANGVMKRVIDDKDNVADWWSSSSNFDLSPKDLRRLNFWNERWRKLEADAPVVETNLLTIADEMK